MSTRRQFIRTIAAAAGVAFTWPRQLRAVQIPPKVTEGAQSEVFRSLNGTPQANTEKVVELMGGIDRLAGTDDIVLIKPNVQWWNQGAPNLAVAKSLVDLVMNRPGGFTGEVILAENCHRGDSPWKHAGWAAPFERNSDFQGVQNYTDLCRLLKSTYAGRFSVVHWINVKDGGQRVSGPKDGPGYVFCDGTGWGAPDSVRQRC
jgi:hypothetical protein